MTVSNLLFHEGNWCRVCEQTCTSEQTCLCCKAEALEQTINEYRPLPKEVAVLNTSIIELDDSVTSTYVEVTELTLQEARELVKAPSIVSFVGHEATVQLINAVLNLSLQVSRERFKFRDGEVVLALKLLVRLPEGKVLNREELQQLYAEGKIKFYMLNSDYGYDPSGGVVFANWKYTLQHRIEFRNAVQKGMCLCGTALAQHYVGPVRVRVRAKDAVCPHSGLLQLLHLRGAIKLPEAEEPLAFLP